MKTKIYKTVVFTGNLLFIIFALGFIFLYIKEKAIDSKDDIVDRKTKADDSKTLSQYLKNKIGFEYDIAVKDMNCSLLNDNNILLFGNDYIVLSDYSVYETIFGSKKTFSNNEQCKLIQTDKEIVKVKKYQEQLYLIDSNNNIYIVNGNKIEKDSPYIPIRKMLLDDDIIYIGGHITPNDNKSYNINDYLLLKTDGNIYKRSYKTTTDESGESSFSKISEEIFINKDKYGDIKDFLLSYDGTKSEITSLISDNGYYVLEDVETEDCKTYIDIKCDKELVLNSIYSKYKKDVKYIDSSNVITKDNKIISTYYLSKKEIEY